MPPSTAVNVIAPAVAAGDEERIWTRILNEVGSKNASNSLQGSVLVLGDRQSGKSSLLWRLRGRELGDGSGGGEQCGLEYHIVQVATERDASYAYQLGGAAMGAGNTESLKLPVWTLDGDPAFAPLIRFSLSPPVAPVVVLCASLARPGEILPSLRRWTEILGTQITRLYDHKAIDEAKQTQRRFWQEYVEPLESSMSMIASMALDSADDVLPLPDEVLTENTGAALIVVVTASDLSPELGEDQLDRLQLQLRRFCLAHGAALIFTSARLSRNTNLLLKYLLHRLYRLPFTTPHIVDRDSVFIPAGWDNEQKLDIIRETLTDPNAPFQVVHCARDHVLSGNRHTRRRVEGDARRGGR